MEPSTKRRSTTGDDGLVVHVDWSTGPRTPAWERLWRAILSDLGPLPLTDTREPLESEVGDV